MTDYGLLMDEEEKSPTINKGGVDYGAIMDAEVNRSSAIASIAKNTNPETFAKAKRLGSEIGVPAEVAERNLPEVERTALSRRVANLFAESPTLAKSMSGAEFAKLSHDNIDNLVALEKSIKSDLLKNKGFAEASRFSRATSDLRMNGVIERAKGLPVKSGTFGESLDKGMVNVALLGDISTYLLDKGITNIGSNFLPKPASSSTPQFVNQQAENSLIDTLSKFQSMAGSQIINNVAQAYENNSGINAPYQALKEAVTSPIDALKYLTEQLPAGVFGGGIGGYVGKSAGLKIAEKIGLNAAKTIIARNLASGAGVNAGATFLGGLSPNTADGFNGENLDESLIQGLKQTSAESGVAALFGAPLAVGGMGVKTVALKALGLSPLDESLQTVAGNSAIGRETSGGELAASAILGAMGAPADIAGAAIFKENILDEAKFDNILIELSNQMDKQQQAQQFSEGLAKIQETVRASEVLFQRSPETFAQFMQQAAEDGDAPKEVFINAEVFNQAMTNAGVSLDQLLPSVAEQMALATAHTDIAIPTGDWAAYIATQPIGDELLNHIKIYENGASIIEAKRDAEIKMAEFNEDVKKIFATKQTEDAFIQGAQQVEDYFFNSLEEIGKGLTKPPTTIENKAQAVLARDMMVTFASKLGITPDQAHKILPLSLVGEGVGEYDQQGNLQTNTPQFSNWFGDSKVVDAEGKPLVVYHGTVSQPRGDAKGFSTFNTKKNELGSHFGNTSQANSFTHADNGRVMPVYLTVKNPLRMKDEGAWDIGTIHKQLMDMGILTEQQVESIANIPDEAAVEVMQGIIKANGYDGIVYLNRREGMSRETIKSLVKIPLSTQESWTDQEFNNNARDASDSYIVFEPNQIKSATGNNGNFDPNDTNILNQSTRGGFNPATLQIILNKDADITTFQHEMWHFYLEAIERISDMDNAPADIKNDLDLILQWQNVTGNTPSERLATWRNMGIEEKRPIHEALAYNGEIYLTSGKAPSVSLYKVFQNFTQWFKRAYISIRDELNAIYKDEFGTDLPMLNKDIRGVMDRALASDQQIKQAERMQSYMSLFQTQEEADSFDIVLEEYQALGNEATQTAIEEQTARSLRDMRWLENAKTREIAKLQKQSKGLRHLARMQARSEVMSEPVYMAWQFLTAKEGKADKKVKPIVTTFVDPTTDSLFTAIAKLGGLDRKELLATWGANHADLPNSGIKGKPIARKDGGISIDRMAELLSQDGYFELDENGKWDLHEFEDKFFEELRGNPQMALLGIDAQFQREMEAKYGTEAQQLADIANLPSGKLNRSEMLGMYGDAFHKIDDMVKVDGLPIEVVAEYFGFSSADEMVRGLMTSDDPKTAIENRTNKIMLDNHAEMATEEAIEASAQKAIHNEARGRFIATGLNAVTKSKGDVRLLNEAAKQVATEQIGQKVIGKIKPNQFSIAERKAGKDALASMKKGDTEQAAAHLRSQLLNNHLTRSAIEALDNVQKSVKYLKKFEKASVRKALDSSYVDQIDKLMERFELTRKSNKQLDRRSSLASWIKYQEELGNTVALSEEQLNDIEQVNYTRLTVDEFNTIVDAVKNIEHLGRLKNKLLTAQDQRNFKVAMNEVKTSIIENSKGTVEEKLEGNKTLLDKAGKYTREFFAMHKKLASMVRVIDGVKDGGAFWNVLVRGMNKAGDTEAVMREQVTMELSKLFAPLRAEGKLDTKVFIPAINASLTREGRIMIALNMGNEGNLQRLMDGDNWSGSQVQAILDTLSKEDIDFVQAVWDYLDTWKPQIAELERKLTGVEPNWIKPQPLQTKYGTLKGGYFPAKYDGDRSTRAMQDEEASNLTERTRAAKGKPSTKSGFTKARANEVKNRPLRKDFGVITQHLSEVTHRLAWQGWIIDARRIMNALDGTLREHYGSENLRVMNDAINDIALGDMPAQNAFESGINHLRVGATIAGLAWNLSTSLLQPIGLTQSISRVGVKWVAKGVGDLLSNPSQINAKIDAIYEKSSFMRLRGKTMQREISEVLNTVRETPLTKVEATYFILIQKAQVMADAPTWIGAYEKAMESVNDEAKAIAMADQAVLDAQGGGQIKDLAKIQRGSPLLKIWTNFYSFFNTTFNLTYEAVNRTDFRKPSDVGLLAVDFLLLYSIPAVMGTLLKEALTGGGDDDEELAKKLVQAQASYLFGTMVGVREISSAISGFNGYSGAAGTRFFSEVGKFYTQSSQGEADTAWFKSLNNTAGILLHYPAGAVNRFVEGAIAIKEGKTNNPMALMVGAPKD